MPSLPETPKFSNGMLSFSPRVNQGKLARLTQRTPTPEFRYSAKSQGENMKIDIDRFGLKDVPVDLETVFIFPNGIVGFEECRRFKLFHEEGKPTIFWLQSLDDLNVMFPIVAPEMFDLEYEIELSPSDCEVLGYERQEDLAVVLMIYREQTPGGAIAAKTRSPLVLNLKTRCAIQKVLRELDPKVVYRGR